MVKVGKTKPSGSTVPSSGIGSANNTPPDTIPQAGQVPGHSADCACRKEHWAVLQEHEPRSNDASDSHDFAPESTARTSDARTLSSARQVLARPARCDAIHSAGVLFGVPLGDVALVHDESGEPSVSGSGSQDGTAEWDVFDGCDVVPAEEQARVEAAPGSCEEVEGSHIYTSSDRVTAGRTP
jgi:hypothetical protein